MDPMLAPWTLLSGLLAHLIVQPFVGQLFLFDDHPESKDEHDDAMACIPEHHREQERECDDAEWGWRMERNRQ